METLALGFNHTSVGKKVVMAITGFFVFFFVTVHIVGNLQIFQGPEKLNAYADLLQRLGPILWAFRVVLFISAVLHIVSATQVTLQSWKARSTRYKVRRYRGTTYAARTMRWGGPIIGLFVLYHLLHFTFGVVHSDFSGSVYHNVVAGFQIWWVSLVYMAALVFLGLHLYHGVWSMFQSVGAAHPKWNLWLRGIAVGFALFLTGAGLSVPLAVLSGVVVPVAM